MAERWLPGTAAGTQLLHAHMRALQASELGVTLIDTADIYGQGKNEELVGERDELCCGCAWGVLLMLLHALQLLKSEQCAVLRV